MQTILVLNTIGQSNEILESMIGSLSLNTLFIDNLAKAYQVLKTQSVDLFILIDHEALDSLTEMLMQQWSSHYSQIPFLILDETPSIERAIKRIKMGAKECLLAPYEHEKLCQIILSHLPPVNHENPPTVVSPQMNEVYVMAKKVASLQASVLLTGESGTGKEILAQFIHKNSGFKGNFIAVNCAAIPENMLEATLFGFEKGAFTGAYAACPGKFELAEQGTLFLDEITEMPLNLQVKLLRVLQEKQMERLGSKKTLNLTVRIIAASNRNLWTQLKAGQFREDLYYRLNVFPINIPPLRARTEEILPLAEKFLQKYAKAYKTPLPKLSQAAKKYLIGNAWPGNVRELENSVQRALILQQGPKLEAKDFNQIAKFGGEK